jgi:hypothetical protein
MKKKSSIEKFLALSDAQKAAEVARFDKPLPLGRDGLPGRPLTVAQRKLWAQVQRETRRGRPKLGQGAKMIPVSIERGLLQEVNAYAKTHRLNRSQMVAQGLRLFMGGKKVAG